MDIDPFIFADFEIPFCFFAELTYLQTALDDGRVGLVAFCANQAFKETTSLLGVCGFAARGPFSEFEEEGFLAECSIGQQCGFLGFFGARTMMVRGMSMFETEELVTDTFCGGRGRRIQLRLAIFLITTQGLKDTGPRSL